MNFARSLLLVCLMAACIPTGAALAAWPLLLPGDASPPGAEPGYLPPDADPNYSTPGGFDRDVDMNLSTRKFVTDATGEAPGTLTVDTKARKLFLSLGDGRAIEYRIGVGRQGFSWKGLAEVGRKAFWPGWTPPPEMLARQRGLPGHMDGGMENPPV